MPLVSIFALRMGMLPSEKVSLSWIYWNFFFFLNSTPWFLMPILVEKFPFVRKSERTLVRNLFMGEIMEKLCGLVLGEFGSFSSKFCLLNFKLKTKNLTHSFLSKPLTEDSQCLFSYSCVRVKGRVHFRNI